MLLFNYLICIFSIVTSGVAGDDFVKRMVDEINAARALRGVRPVCTSVELMNIAQDYAQRQSYYRDGSHTAGGQSPEVRAANYGEAAENCFNGNCGSCGDAKYANDQLLKSSMHAVNIENPNYTHVGIGRAQVTSTDGQPHYYWVQFFARIDNEPCNAQNPVTVEPIAPQPVAEPLFGGSTQPLFGQPDPQVPNVESPTFQPQPDYYHSQPSIQPQPSYYRPKPTLQPQPSYFQPRPAAPPTRNIFDQSPGYPPVGSTPDYYQPPPTHQQPPANSWQPAGKSHYRRKIPEPTIYYGPRGGQARIYGI